MQIKWFLKNIEVYQIVYLLTIYLNSKGYRKLWQRENMQEFGVLRAFSGFGFMKDACFK